MELTPHLLEALRAAIPTDTVIVTLANQRPNRVVAIEPRGVTIETERSAKLGREPELVPAWMIQTAWDQLQRRGELSNSELVSSAGLNVKRSSAVCALLAQFAEVTVVSRRPIVLRVRRAGDGHQPVEPST
jgi:hypothetical protein